jgi:hypothetical protein
MVEGAARRREFYLAKIKEAQEFAAKVHDPAARQGMQAVIEAYRKLLARLDKEAPEQQ